ncbi:MAG TPA: DinB family protein [Candidatus Limnocylindria bacterium]|nr:DinB family protein [Candidatus Limnocylindria bacterium]
MSTTTAVDIRAASRKLSAADFAGTIRSYYPYWDVQYRPYLIMAVEAFPADRLDFKPRPELLTARQMILHIAECERGWIYNVVEGGPYEDWVVEHEDPAQGWVIVGDPPDHATLLSLLEKWHRNTQHWLGQPVSELARVITYQPPEGSERRYTLHWILDHLQEHEIHHRAQLNTYMRMIGIQPPSI